MNQQHDPHLPEPRMRHVMVYGSCVTRDGVDIAWDDLGLVLAGYVARQSLISSYAPADIRQFTVDSVGSAFQRRMIMGDVRSSLRTLIRDQAGEVDHIIWDFTDERLGVSAVPTGGYVTRVLDYEGGIYRGSGRLGAPVRLGDPKHLSLWREAVEDFVEQLDHVGAREKLIVNATPWATLDEQGNRTSYPGIRPDEFNDTIEVYYEHIRKFGVRVVRPDPQTVVARSDHKWGSAPFHYIDAAYRSVLRSAFD